MANEFQCTMYTKHVVHGFLVYLDLLSARICANTQRFISCFIYKFLYYCRPGNLIVSDQANGTRTDIQLRACIQFVISMNLNAFLDSRIRVDHFNGCLFNFRRLKKFWAKFLNSSDFKIGNRKVSAKFQN